jgi:hypothetical protein
MPRPRGNKITAESERVGGGGGGEGGGRSGGGGRVGQRRGMWVKERAAFSPRAGGGRRDAFSDTL